MASTQGKTLAPDAESPSYVRPLWMALLIVAAVLIAYIPAFSAGRIWDDDDHLPDTPIQQSWTGLKFVWTKLGATPQYYPLTHTTFWLEKKIWGDSLWPHHTTNVLLHAANSILLWRILVCLKVRGAFAAAVIFALHPVHVESVAWISERKNVQSAFFYLSAGLAYLKFANISSERDEKQRPRWELYAFALLLFTCALLSKTVTSTLPAALALMLWWKRKLTWRHAVLLLPMLVAGIAFGRITAWMEKSHVGAAGRHWDWDFLERCLIAGRVLWFYPSKLIWPVNLTFIYPKWTIDAHQWWQYVFPAGVAAVLALLWFLRHRIGRGPLVAVLFFMGTIFPALGFINVYPMRFSFVADHFQYLASTALIALLAATLTSLISRNSQNRVIPMAIVAMLAIVLGSLTFRQARIYKDMESLWRDTLAKNPHAWIAHANISPPLEAKGDIAGARMHLEYSLQLEPDQTESHIALAGLLQRQGDLAGAETHLRQAREIDPNNPLPLHRLGLVAAARGDFAQAASLLEELLGIYPHYEPAELDLAAVRMSQGNIEQAWTLYQGILERNPYSFGARQQCAAIMDKSGLTNEAIDLLIEGESLGIETATSANNLGVMLQRVKRTPEAAERFRRAIDLDPNFAEAHLNLAGAMEIQGNIPAAVASYRQALRLKPQLTAAREALQRLNASP